MSMYRTDCLSDEEQRAVIREVIGCCPQVNTMPSGTGYIEAVCVWADRSAYVLLCRNTRQVLRYQETITPPLCKLKTTKRQRA